MSATTLPGSAAAGTGDLLDRLRASVAAAGAAVLGAAPHVLHHVGPRAGAALLAGATGRLLFGAAGFLLAIPMLRRLYWRHGSWAVPGGVLALMAVVFMLSTFILGPAITGGGAESSTPADKDPRAPARVVPSEHESHH